jgi:hypothetical protein
VCIVGFYGKLPNPSVVDRIVRNALETAVLADPKTDILASAMLGNDNLTSNQYSGSLIYHASDRRIMSRDEAMGVRPHVSETSTYFILEEERQTLTPKDPAKTPVHTWLSLTIVFPTTPPRDEAYAAMLTEIEKRIGRRLDIIGAVDVGDKNIKTSWHQVRDTDGAFIFAEYSAATRTVSRKNRVLERFP